MKLRWLKRDRTDSDGDVMTETVLQYYDPKLIGCLGNNWLDVPTVEEPKKEWCEHIKILVDGKYHAIQGSHYGDLGEYSEPYCCLCGTARPR